MVSRDTNTQPLIVIVGPTASGKTTAAIEIAKKVGGEIICADSRTVYKGMDIGTAKPTLEQQKEVSHHLLDVVYPDEKFSAADFQKLAKEEITDIRSRKKVPIMVGGTGLYVDSIIFDYVFGVQSSEKLRKKFEKSTIEELWEYCVKNNVELPENKHNKRYIIRAIEQNGINNHKRNKIIDNCFVVGIATDKEELRRRIMTRANGIFSEELMQETQRLADIYGWSHESMTANIYALADKVNRQELTREEALEKFVTLDWRLAKRQLTWLKRNQEIAWVNRQRVIDVVMKYFTARQTWLNCATIEHDSYTRDSYD